MPPIKYLTRSPGLGLPHGLYDFTEEVLESKILPNRAGNYAIGYIAPIGGFAPKIIGGSDSDLLQEMLRKLDTAKERGYDKFCFKYANSPEDRFEQECLNYHSFRRQLDNKKHPCSPEGTKLSCPDKVCAQFFQYAKDT